MAADVQVVVASTEPLTFTCTQDATALNIAAASAASLKIQRREAGALITYTLADVPSSNIALGATTGTIVLTPVAATWATPGLYDAFTTVTLGGTTYRFPSVGFVTVEVLSDFEE